MLYIASDHAGFALKKYLVKYLKHGLKKPIKDLGPKKYSKDDDYPEFAGDLSKKVAADKNAKGIIICGSGHGVCLVANKFRGIRAILGYSIEAAELGRQDEDANILCLAGWVLSAEHAAAIVKKFLETEFSAKPRHQRRIMEIKKIEEKN